MTTLAVTGHMDLTEGTVPLVRDAFRSLLAQYAGPDLVGISCIARGADSLFAEAILDAGGRLVVVLPSQDYREVKVKPDRLPLFDRLVEAADRIVVMPHETPNRAAYEAANREVLARADRLVAVWNGQPPAGKGGGTADVVIEARALGIPVDVVWPQGAQRTV
ncbi:hypothetical protein [Streptantibioticus ferralitis]|uniref:DNA recombination-mediator protein A n=1 Tax=Streptantibioticus ferralitis TaxID=236510 RepID=A0ABT5ZCW6_9ACTN|nr:hypothetical protein [Streptantibioticus ferralitis]MDF2261421.1 hypothetical protein [Streptantibioticus ferralitis]